MRRAHKNGVLLGGVVCVVCVVGRVRTDFNLSQSTTPVCKCLTDPCSCSWSTGAVASPSSQADSLNWSSMTA